LVNSGNGGSIVLDLDHPRTPHVFAASRQEDLILDYCKRITLAGAAGRRFMLEVIRPAFAALRWLNKERFGDSLTIASGIDQWEREVEALVGLPLIDPDHCGGPASRCPACGGKPIPPSKYGSRVPYCSSCLGGMMPGLRRVRSFEEGFGTDAI
jgi:hypothetical protein